MVEIIRTLKESQSKIANHIIIIIIIIITGQGIGYLTGVINSSYFQSLL
jgi:hypothetical protein